LENYHNADPEIFGAIREEMKRQQEQLVLIASENYCSPAVKAAQGSCLTDKYAEGYPHKRWYTGCDNVDDVEAIAIERAKELFGADHANVQPHCGCSANITVYLAQLNPGDRILSMKLDQGGHLSHGLSKNLSGRLYEIFHYGVDPETEQIDYDEVMDAARRCRPHVIIAGASSYPRAIDFERFGEIAREVGAKLMVDLAHIAGLVAAGVHPDPVPHADFVTSTTHKTLRGPRGGFILCRKEYAEAIDTEVFPGLQGGPLMHVIAAKAVCFKEAMTDEFRSYAAQIVKNSKAMAACLQERGYRIVSGGTDNHLFLVDVSAKGMTGREAAARLYKANISANKNTIPFDKCSPYETSGIRIGTPAVTTRGMKEPEMALIADCIDRLLSSKCTEMIISEVKGKVLELCSAFPVRPECACRDSLEAAQEPAV